MIETYFYTFLFLYFINLLLDYPLQGEFLGIQKSNYNYLLFVHSAIWGFGISIALYFLGMLNLWKIIFLVIGHYWIDYLKCRKVWFMKKLHPLKGALYINQLLHVVQLFLVTIF
jgi:hypothetical protein